MDLKGVTLYKKVCEMTLFISCKSRTQRPTRNIRSTCRLRPLLVGYIKASRPIVFDEYLITNTTECMLTL